MNVHRRSTQAEEDKKAGRKPTRVKRDRSANNLTIISDDGWETVPTDDRFRPTVLVAKGAVPVPRKCTY